jgi:2Fe-2S ferredoxin
MPRVTFMSHQGITTVIDVAPGTSLMRAAVSNGIPGIVGECGGVLSCATCHVYVDPVALDRLPPMNDLEDEMLEGVASERQPNSRLSCQIVPTPELGEITVTMPARQEF